MITVTMRAFHNLCPHTQRVDVGDDPRAGRHGLLNSRPTFQCGSQRAGKGGLSFPRDECVSTSWKIKTSQVVTAFFVWSLDLAGMDAASDSTRQEKRVLVPA